MVFILLVLRPASVLATVGLDPIDLPGQKGADYESRQQLRSEEPTWVFRIFW